MIRPASCMHVGTPDGVEEMGGERGPRVLVGDVEVVGGRRLAERGRGGGQLGLEHVGDDQPGPVAGARGGDRGAEPACGPR